MLHPSMDPATAARRQTEFEAARSRYEVDRLHEKWAVEDRAVIDARSAQGSELSALRQRVATLERILGPGGRALVDGLVPGIADAVGQAIAKTRKEILAEVESRGFVTYRGVWDETADYQRGALVTCAGSAWIALAPCTKGARPGKAAEWRLAIKSEASKPPGVA